MIKWYCNRRQRHNKDDNGTIVTEDKDNKDDNGTVTEDKDNKDDTMYCNRRQRQ